MTIRMESIEAVLKWRPKNAPGRHDQETHGSWAVGGTVESSGRDTVVLGAIQRAIAEDPRRATHGNTGKNAFWIDADGKVYSYDKYHDVPKTGELAMVHSHSADAGAPGFDWETEVVDPLNSGDVEAWQGMANKVFGSRLAATYLIQKNGNAERLSMPDNMPADKKQAFLSLSKAQVRKQLDAGYDERAEYWHRTGKPESELYHEKLRTFANKYGLEYVEGLNWKLPKTS